jgi:hypothetical protein
MTEEMEKLIGVYYEDSIELPENRLLCFKRVLNYKFTDRHAVKVSIDDLETGSSIELGMYFDATWTFSSPMNERTFWQHVKSNIHSFREVFDRMRIKVPRIKEFHSYRIKFTQTACSVSSNLDKLTAIFKSKPNGPNV